MSAGVDGVVLVGGEALVDLVPNDGVLHPHPGGGPFNTARTIGRLGQPVAYLGRLSTDQFGTEHQQLLTDDGVGLQAAVRTGQPSTLAIAEVDAAGAARYRFYAYGTAAPGLTPEAALAALPPEVAAVHIGTLGLVLEPLADALEATVAALGARALVMVDPNCRPGAIEDPGAYRARLERVLADTDVVKVSDDDLAYLDPARTAAEAARALLVLGPRVVLLTRGREGALVVTAEGDIAVPAPPIQVVDTIGAGDAFGGGFLAWWRANGLGAADLADRDALLDATRFAVMVAARTCERAGAWPPRLEELGAAAIVR
jgi:fructokinase